MSYDTRITALKFITLALDEVQARDGQLPTGDPEAGEAAPETFYILVKQYAGNRTSESDLVAAIDAISPMFPDYMFPWK